MTKIAIIRIKGNVKINKEIKESLNRLRLRKKYSCRVIENPKESEIGMIKKLKNFVAYGELDEETYKELVSKRAGKIKNFFRLHPPIKGIDSKKMFGVGKGVLGDNKEKINNLIKRML